MRVELSSRVNSSGVDVYNPHRRARTVRIAACTMRTTLGDPAANARAALDIAGECHDERAAVAVFPELALTGYSLDDILMQDALLDATEEAIHRITQASVELMSVLVIGAPLRYRHRIYNTAVVIHRGRVLGIATKSYLPTYREFYELRQMAAGDDICDEISLGRGSAHVRAPLGPDLLFSASDLPGFTLHVEICEDMWIPIPPSARAALAGATVLTNLSGSPATIGRAQDRCLLARSASLRCVAAYIYAASGQGESTTDLAWDGHTMIWENGVRLAESQRFPKDPSHCVADVDLDLLCLTRQRIGIFDGNRRHHRRDRVDFREIEFALDAPTGVRRMTPGSRDGWLR
ncbi:amidohydrolase [Mycobacterium sp. Soil538]|nr:amidohydrolase [Mycobacterium sp. Soil538]